MDDEPYYPDDEMFDPMQLGCLFPGNCLMPGPHMIGECHTAEMMEEQERLDELDNGRATGLS